MVLGASASAQAAALTGTMALPNWSTSSIDVGDGHASVTGDNVTLVSSNNHFAGQTDFWHVFSGAGALSFDWSYTTQDDAAYYDPASYFLNGSRTDLASGGERKGSGSATVNLLASDTFGWTIASTDGFFGPGSLTVSNVSFASTSPAAPAPLAGTGLLSALAALAALAMSRLFGRKTQVA